MIETRCTYGNCIRPRHGWSKLCSMHEKRQERGRDMDAPFRDRRAPWVLLEQAADRHSIAKRSGWSEKALRAAEEQLKRAAEGYRRFCNRQRKARAA